MPGIATSRLLKSCAMPPASDRWLPFSALGAAALELALLGDVLGDDHQARSFTRRISAAAAFAPVNPQAVPAQGPSRRTVPARAPGDQGGQPSDVIVNGAAPATDLSARTRKSVRRPRARSRRALRGQGRHRIVLDAVEVRPSGFDGVTRDDPPAPLRSAPTQMRVIERGAGSRTATRARVVVRTTSPLRRRRPVSSPCESARQARSLPSRATGMRPACSALWSQYARSPARWPGPLTPGQQVDTNSRQHRVRGRRMTSRSSGIVPLCGPRPQPRRSCSGARRDRDPRRALAAIFRIRVAVSLALLPFRVLPARHQPPRRRKREVVTDEQAAIQEQVRVTRVVRERICGAL